MDRLFLSAVIALCIISVPSFITFKVHEPDPCLGSIDKNHYKIFIIGDSTAHGYRKYIPDSTGLPDDGKNFCNGETSRKTLRYIDKWLSRDFDTILWNNGLWDIAVNKKHPGNVLPDDYRKNLLAIGQKIKAHTKYPYFVLTTSVPPGSPLRNNSDVEAYNLIAREAMKELGIPVIDLYTPSLAHPEWHVAPDDVHFTPEGLRQLAGTINKTL